MIVPADALAPCKSQYLQGKLFPDLARVRPFLKWAGGKTRLLPTLQDSLPKEPFNRYFEPFLGGGALFFDLAPSKAVLADANPELMNCYQVVRDCPEELITALSKLRVNEREFYKLRALDPKELSAVARASRLIYLNKTCYNGLYRVNRHGRFNTPYGRHSNVKLVDAANLRRASTLLKRAKLLNADYRMALELAGKGDFVYLDPPYIPVGKFSDFKRYTRDQFHAADHERLAEAFKALSTRGCFVLLSNSFDRQTERLYSGFIQRIVKMPRFVNCKGDGRGHVDELLISNYETGTK